MKQLAVVLLLALTLGTSIDKPNPRLATGTFVALNVPYLPGSAIPISLNGVAPPYQLSLVGPGSLDHELYHVPDDARGSASVVAAASSGLAEHTFDFASPPDATTDFLAVASYDDGIVIHRASAPFAMTSVLAVGGAPGDVAIDSDGTIGTGATDGDVATIARIQPWSVRAYHGVPVSDEVAFDPKTHALYLTNRDINGAGAITRVAPDGTIKQRVLGLTAEGLAVDPVARRVYVANVNDATISIVDADTLVELSRFKAVARVFALALSADGSRLYAISNQSVSSPFGLPGEAVAIDVRGRKPHIVAHSPHLGFPVGIALDARMHRLFVTDERDDIVDVLDERTLKAVHAPLPTCRTPWKPAFDRGRLYVPCARADEIDVFDASLHRVAGAPFATGSYPLSVAIWHGR